MNCNCCFQMVLRVHFSFNLCPNVCFFVLLFFIVVIVFLIPFASCQRISQSPLVSPKLFVLWQIFVILHFLISVFLVPVCGRHTDMYRHTQKKKKKVKISLMKESFLGINWHFKCHQKQLCPLLFITNFLAHEGNVSNV